VQVSQPATPDELAALATTIDGWAAGERSGNPLVAAIDHDPELLRWYVRLRGEQKTITTVWLTLRERTLHFETQFMPAPEENVEALYTYLLRVNARLYSVRFAIGEEDALYLVGQLPVHAVDEDELDRIIGSCFAYTEEYFRAAMRIGYASKFKG
jgi:hypothetical protein